jgi:flavin reductase (DIM6/NTAB) family NADH-FMN oxidoreductase RutF
VPDPSDTPVSPDTYKSALRKFTSGVTIVTAERDAKPHGMTATAFASVSLEPPLILVCLDRGSRTRAAVIETGIFAVNILRRDQEHLARAFATQGQKPFGDIDHSRGANGAPLINEAISRMECSVTEIVPAGDHDIVVGLVTNAHWNEDVPLVYFDRQYRKLKDR